MPLTAPISKGAYVTGLADLTADRLSFSYRSQTHAFFVRMDDNWFRHPHSRKPDLLSLVIASVSFEVICLLNENPPFSNNARNFFFEIDLILLLTPLSTRQLLLQLMNNGGSRILFYSFGSLLVLT